MICRDVALPTDDAIEILQAFGVRPEAIAEFIAQEVTTDLWTDLTHDYLKQLGVTAYGARLKLLTWIHIHMVPPEKQDQERLKTARTIKCLWFLPTSVRRAQQEVSTTPLAKQHASDTTDSDILVAEQDAVCVDVHNTKENASNNCGVTKSEGSIKITRAHQSMCDTLCEIVCANGASAMRPHILAKIFSAKTGKRPQSVFGHDWLTDVKADPRLHYDGYEIVAIKSIRNTPKAQKIARYNINALPHTGVDHRALSHIFHLACLCVPCENCSEQRGRACTYCHHPKHGVYSGKSFRERLSKADCCAKNRSMVVRRQQVFACLKELRVCNKSALEEISRRLGL